MFVFPLLLFVLPACTVTRTHGVVGRRQAVVFENVEAAQTFYEAVLDEQFPSEGSGSLTFNLAPFDIQNETLRDGVAIVAEAIPRADRNGDGTITAAEARVFAGGVPR